MKKLIMLTTAAAFISTGVLAEHHKKSEMKYEKPELSGMFEGDEFMVTMAPQGYFAAAAKDSSVVFVIGKFGAKDGVFWIKDIMAPPNTSDEERACATENKGKYDYAMDGDTVSFTLKEDPCPNRVEALNGATMTRWTPPAPAE